ncbi:hypothetical protein HID58_055493 [Brassica napus]|uniref:Uncharacterized protein n=1 Tax=Brassica napus TaxID=3708 RepID=A0ABQ8AKH6_BRANA|nr:hypothetical protein HID58_055493 [Brassica napus]
MYVSRPVSFAGEAIAKLITRVPRRFRSVTFLMSWEALPHSRVWGNVARFPVSDMMARRDLLVQQVKASARWELMKEWLERRSIGIICSCLEVLTINRGASLRLPPPPRDLLWGRDSQRGPLSE